MGTDVRVSRVRPLQRSRQAERLARVRTACQGKPLEIGIGLESADPRILARRIHKGYTWEDFAAAARLLGGEGCRLLAYQTSFVA